MAIDTHAHYIPPGFLEAVEREPARYGVGFERGRDGRVRLAFPGQAPTRPILPALLDLDRRVKDLDAAGVRHQVLATWMDVVGYALPAELGARWSRRYNECLAEAVRATGGRFSGVATVPLQDGAGAAAELTHAVQQLGLRGVQIGTNVLGRNLDDAGLDPLWEAASALKTPVILHPWHVVGEERMHRHGMIRLVGYPADTTLAAASIIFGGVADRFPDLAVVLVHGGGFYPYQAGRLERAYALLPPPKPQRSALDRLRWFHYDTVTHSAAALRYLAELVGTERIVLGSDAPFDIGDPAPVASVKNARLGEPGERAILEANPVRLFGPVP
ncbi:MAG: amidohydrolase [Candidatus Rokubacteria bacterium]|nr:amidohydrolase [Candidatus Rokubacteria bacterium]